MLMLTAICRDGKGQRCGKPAPFRLLGPAGDVIPGCFMCQDHARECVEEYAQKLGEIWTMLNVETNERFLPESLPAFAPGGICPICHAHNQIVNECRCDPDNLPTEPLTRTPTN